MGSPEGERGRDIYETQHEVTIAGSFLMKATQVTQHEWRTQMINNPSYSLNCDSCPVERVSWYDALAYANALSTSEGLPQCFDCVGSVGDGGVCELKAQYATPQECPGYRLPTEAEWEYAARAGSTVAFHTGDITQINICSNMYQAGWYGANSGSQTHPVKGKAPNAWGVYDMHGNVWEWVWDWYEGYDAAPATDPYGPGGGSERVCRGGSWADMASDCRAASRNSYKPNHSDYKLGFRLVRSL